MPRHGVLSEATDASFVRRSLAALFVSALLVGCGSSGTTGPDEVPVGGFGGTYATTVSLVSNTCGAVTVQNNPTTVTFDDATRGATFRHAGTTYSGTVAADSSFHTAPKVLNVGDGFTYTITLAGRFRRASFEADATVDRADASTTCRYVVHWAATR